MSKIGSGFAQVIAISFVGFTFMGLLFALVDILNCARLGERFTPFSVAYPVSALTYDETQVYVPGPRRFFETNSLNTEVDVFELRGTMGAWPVMHSLIIGSLAKLVGSLEASWIIAHAVFPASAWLLFFFCARKLQLSIAPALALATATCLVPFGLRNFLLIGQNAFIQPLELSRMPHPALSLALLLLGIVAVSRAVTAGSVIAAVSAGILIGLNFYSYYFYWMAIGLGLITWLSVAAILRRRSEVKVLCVVGLAASLTGLPFLVALAAARSQGLTNLMERFGVFYRGFSIINLSLALIITSAAIFLYTRNRMPPVAIALAFALAGGALGLNAHLLTGYDAQDYQHLTSMWIQPLSFFLLGVVVLQWLSRSWYQPWPWILATLMLVILGAYRQVRVAHNVADDHDRTQNSVRLVETLGSQIHCRLGRRQYRSSSVNPIARAQHAMDLRPAGEPFAGIE